MAAQTPDTGSRFDVVNGNVRQVFATFASVSANDTWSGTGLSQIINAQGTAGGTAALLTFSNGTLTFKSTSTNVNVCLTGY